MLKKGPEYIEQCSFGDQRGNMASFIINTILRIGGYHLCMRANYQQIYKFQNLLLFRSIIIYWLSTSP